VELIEALEEKVVSRIGMLERDSCVSMMAEGKGIRADTVQHCR
jgi:hypothetical protein